MTSSGAWFSARELAGAPGMPTSDRNTRSRLQAMGLVSRKRIGMKGGGGFEFDCSTLPASTREAAALRRAMEALTGIEPVAPPAPTTSVAVVTSGLSIPPSESEKAVADARLLLVNAVLELAQVEGLKKATHVLSLQLLTRKAAPALLEVLSAATQRSRQETVSSRTLFRWYGAHRLHGWGGLLPRAQSRETQEVDQDVAATLGVYMSRDPQFRKLTAAAMEINSQLGRPDDDWVSLYHRARRALPKLDKVQVIKARHLGAQRAAKLPFKRRDTSNLEPNDCWLVDGHTFKAKVRHPVHGAPFVPEVTLCIDAATRLVTGWSVSLSENTIAVGDALRHAVSRCGVPAVVYTDNGSGQTGRQIDCPIAGLIARLGAEHRTGLPGHPQGHGLIERSWQTHMINAARKFGSYQGKDVDPTSFRKAAAELAKEQRALKRAETSGEVVQLSSKAPSWKQFMEAVAEAVERYNVHHRHSALPKDDEGKHWTPAQAWQHKADPERLVRVTEQQVRSLFMPAEIRTARRGEVQFLNQVYAAPELMAVDGEQVRCHYDVHDPSYVWIFTISGRYVCEAKFGANVIDYFPKAVIEQAREKRARAAIKRLDAKRELAMREVRDVLDARPSEAIVVLPPVGESTPASREALARDERPELFDNASDRYEWLATHRTGWNATDADWLAGYVESDDYRVLASYFANRGLAWNPDLAPGSADKATSQSN